MATEEIYTMAKKAILGTLLVGLIGLLIAGAIIRTVDKTDNVAEAREQRRGQTGAEIAQMEAQPRGQGFGGGAATRQYPNYADAPADWSVIEGTVLQASEAGGDLVIETADGEELVVGTGPGYLADQGFALQAGESVRIEGYWEDSEFKAAQVTRLRDGQFVTLRDQVGRPAWAGNGQGRGTATGDGTGIPQPEADVDEWVTIEGTVLHVDADAMVVQTAHGEEIVVEGRSWRFAQELTFSAGVGDQVTLLGFYEDGDFEVGHIADATNGRSVSLREESGRPMWAGRGRGGG
jgi:hypothetical protein